MALWQVGFFILPKGSLKHGGKLDKSEEHTFDDAPFWESLNIDYSFFDPIKRFLPEGKSWSKNVILYGEENSHRLEVLFENSIIISVSFRIDFTSDYEQILNEIIEFCIFNGLIILDEDLNILPLNFQSVKSIIENSPQVKKYNRLSNQ